MKASIIERQRGHLDAAVIARVVDTLRAEAVNLSEAATSAERDLRDNRVAMDRLTDRTHRLNGEREALRGERSMLLVKIESLEGELAEHRRSNAELDVECRRLRAEERLLRSKVEEQDEHLGRLYAEIERLTGIIGTMERTTAWRWHKRVERLRGRS
jgi:chromosome segregation ATPase